MNLVNKLGVFKRIANEKMLALKSKQITIEIAELFFQHNSKTGFKRFDIIVRLLAIDNYFGKNDYGFDFYCRMQASRKSKRWVSPSVERFRSLIESYAKNGYNEKSKIILDENLQLVDGSHRIAMAIYYQIPTITALVRSRRYDVFYGIEWFKVNGFTDKECQILVKRFESLKKSYITPFVCTLWAPVHEYFDEITEKLRIFGETAEIRDFAYSEDEYAFYTRGIYHVDDIEKWKIEKKIDYMHKSSPDCHLMRMVALYLEEPKFRLKAKTNNTLSVQCELIKKLIREAYKDKVKNYYHDIIIHIGDNYRQNRHIYRLFMMPPIDVMRILQGINSRMYVLTKFETPYMPTGFPATYPLGKDIDIICSDMNEYGRVVDCLLLELKNYDKYYCIRIVKKVDEKGKEYRTLVRLEQDGQFLVLQFDVASKMTTNESVSDCTSDMIKTRVEKAGFYVPQVKYEIIVRFSELYNSPNKKYHLDYIKNHIDELDEQLCNRYLKFNWKKFLNK